ncbi:hypothetical protein FA95DRAFT_1595318 [Auriscalpium vulgare]|uniref:Uncharacterized protein n=1 Tax=Auriscalpium vulgare TaxID=40419 RepID=A0ACB8RVT9_9AGAM|nr:hypothetical protein FA95DRAFT_1595318 [Auriscalpium vulgare]
MYHSIERARSWQYRQKALVPASLSFDRIIENAVSSELVKLLTENADTPPARALLASALTSRDYLPDLDLHALNSAAKSGPGWDAMLIGLVSEAVDVPGTSEQMHYSTFECLDHQCNERYKMDVYGDAPPSGALALEFVRRTIARPSPPQQPTLPTLMVFSHDFIPYHHALAPFLDSLPAPLTWRMAEGSHLPARPAAAGLAPLVLDPDEEDDTDGDSDYSEGDTVTSDEPIVLDVVLARAMEAKLRGNRALAAHSHARANDAYFEAIEWLGDALQVAPAESDEAKRAYKILAVVMANRSALFLQLGSKRGIEQAVGDGLMATMMDPTYAKGYYRQARALVALGDVERAREVLEKAQEHVAVEDMRNIEDAFAALHTTEV